MAVACLQVQVNLTVGMDPRPPHHGPLWSCPQLQADEKINIRVAFGDGGNLDKILVALVLTWCIVSPAFDMPQCKSQVYFENRSILVKDCIKEYCALHDCFFFLLRLSLQRNDAYPQWKIAYPRLPLSHSHSLLFFLHIHFPSVIKTYKFVVHAWPSMEKFFVWNARRAISAAKLVEMSNISLGRMANWVFIIKRIQQISC